jgi:hypothetical protein
MRFNDFNISQKNTRSDEQLFQFSIVITARSETQISPFKIETVGIQFPCLNATVGNIHGLMIKSLGDTTQLIRIACDVGVFHQSREDALIDVLNPALVDLVCSDAILNTVEPQVDLEGTEMDWEAVCQLYVIS